MIGQKKGTMLTWWVFVSWPRLLPRLCLRRRPTRWKCAGIACLEWLQRLGDLKGGITGCYIWEQFVSCKDTCWRHESFTKFGAFLTNSNQLLSQTLPRDTNKHGINLQMHILQQYSNLGIWKIHHKYNHRTRVDHTCYKKADISFGFSYFVGCHAAVDSRRFGFSYNKSASSLQKNRRYSAFIGSGAWLKLPLSFS